MKSAPFCVERFSYTLKVVVASKSFRIPLCASTKENASISRKASDEPIGSRAQLAIWRSQGDVSPTLFGKCLHFLWCLHKGVS